MRRFSALVMIVLPLMAVFYIFTVSWGYEYDYVVEHNTIGNIYRNINSFAAEGLRKIEGLEGIAQKISLFLGNIKRDDVFITDSYLLEDVQNTDQAATLQNIEYLKQQLDKFEQPSYLMLIPTSCAIKQQVLPAQINNLFNQKNFISSVYGQCTSLASTVDIYSNLFAAKDQYIYYRNSSNLTALGGYYVYQSLAARLGITARSLDQFEVEHLSSKYYGDLAKKADYYKLPGDIITLYKFSRYQRYYMINHYSGGDMRNYYTLFPKHLEALGRPQDVVLGGLSQRVDISASSPYQESCLLIGDKTALSYLPFLTVHYGSITFLDINYLEETLPKLSVDEYDQVIVGLSIDSLLNKQIYSK